MNCQLIRMVNSGWVPIWVGLVWIPFSSDFDTSDCGTHPSFAATWTRGTSPWRGTSWRSSGSAAPACPRSPLPAGCTPWWTSGRTGRRPRTRAASLLCEHKNLEWISCGCDGRILTNTGGSRFFRIWLNRNWPLPKVLSKLHLNLCCISYLHDKFKICYIKIFPWYC